MSRAVQHAGLVALILAVALPSGEALAEDLGTPAGPLEPVKSMGQPLRIKPYLAASLAWTPEGETSVGGLATAGLYKDLVLPLTGLLGLSGEGYVGGTGGDWDGGVRLFATSRLFFLNVGVDWNARLERADFILGFTPYFRRGGLFGRGGNFRIEWIPQRNNTLQFGFQIPLEPHMGRTRPRNTRVSLPRPPAPPLPSALPPGAEAAVADFSHAGVWLSDYTAAFNDEDDSSRAKAMARFREALDAAKTLLDTKDDRHPEGHSYEIESRHYNEGVDTAFAAAVGQTEGRAVSDLAREVLLDEVLLPYDRLIGQFKKPDTLQGLSGRARVRLATALKERPLGEARQAHTLAVFDRLLDVVEDSHQTTKAFWDGDERRVWLPLDLALRPEQFDSQEELDGLIARAVGRPFTGGNAVFPTNAPRFQLELLKSIRAAEDYHVLWIHDYAGLVDGEPDPIAFAITVEGYLRTLAERVRQYDETGRLPIYMIFQTQFFYEGSQSRLYLSLLEDPMGHELKLGRGHEDMERDVRAAQEELRQAVAGSARLQAEAQERGKDWLNDIVKVHVSVTFPADLSFRTPLIAHFLPFTPDTLMLDHRKLFFYDLTEEDPRRGRALFSGTGVGAEYASPTWNDRGVLVTGPAALQLREEARRLLRSQGFREDEIPGPLQRRPRSADYDAHVAELVAEGHSARALNVHNEVGFGRKEATLAQSIQYTLAPPDTLIISPDSLWTSPFWAGQLAGAALRGCHVYVVAASAGNSATDFLPVLARTREIFARLLELEKVLGSEIRAAGGHLRVGLYTRAAPGGDTLARVREAAEGYRRYPFLLDELPLPRDTVAMLEEMASELESAGYRPDPIAEGTREGRPKLHRKTQLFATRHALRAVADHPETSALLRRQVALEAQVSGDFQKVLEDVGDFPIDTVTREAMEDEPPEGARDGIYYYTVGSKNQNPRSAHLDGETSFIVSGPWSFFGYSDFMFLMAATTWVESEAELNELLPAGDEGSRRLGRMTGKLI